MSPRPAAESAGLLAAALAEIVPRVMERVLPERYTPELAAQIARDVLGRLRAQQRLRWGCPPDCGIDHDAPGAPEWHVSHRIETAMRDIDSSLTPEERAQWPWLGAQVVVINDRPQAYGRETRVWIDFGTSTGELSPAEARQALEELRGFTARFEGVVAAAERTAADDFAGDPEIARLDREAEHRRTRAV